MAKKNDLKKPNDYPLFAYRVLPGIKVSMTEMLERVLKLYNSKLSENEKPLKKNDIFVQALERGLNEIEKEQKKRR